MGKLIYSVVVSLDGYHTDADGDYSWAVPSEEVIAALNADAADVSTFLLGRHMYESMAPWETDPTLATQSPELAVFAKAWQSAQKVVVSRTLTEVWTQRTRLLHELDADVIEQIKEQSEGDITVEGPTLARSALALGVVDVIELVWCPVVIGGGMRALPDDVRLDLRLRRERRFANGMVQATYDVHRG